MSKLTKIVLGSMLLLFFIFLYHNNLKINPSAQNDQVANVSNPVLAKASTTTPSNFDTATLARVVDGDTIVVKIGGSDKKVRLIGVNTPETVDPRKAVQCFGKEASDYLKSILKDGTVILLESDSSQDNIDKYGRLLRYVWLGDIFINKEIIRDGFGYEYTYRFPYKYQKEFKTDQYFAKENNLGLWGSNKCQK